MHFSRNHKNDRTNERNNKPTNLRDHKIPLDGGTNVTRMVQLPDTAAIEYVAACWVPGAGGIFVGGTRTRTRTKTKTKTKTARGAYARSPQVQCVYEPSRLSVPSMIYVYPAGGRIQLT